MRPPIGKRLTRTGTVNESAIFAHHLRRMWRALLCLLPLGGCSPITDSVNVVAGIEAVSLPVLGRGTFDAAYSAITGRDCSVVRLDRGEHFCRAPEGPPVPPPFCTGSLGRADCWERPDLLPGTAPGLADTPPPTPAQLADRTARWPRSLDLPPLPERLTTQ